MYIIDTELEKKEILKRYRALLKVCRPNIDKNDKLMIRKAFNLAVEAHKDMRRQTGEPYVYHPIAVAHICTNEIGLGGTSVICALLHDVVEDTDYKLIDIQELFGEKVARIVDGLTKLKGIFDKGTGNLQAENYKKMLLTLSDDVRVILIKLADRLHNMRTLEGLPHEKQLRVSYETTYLFAPLAHRLGFYNIKSEMEDIAFRYTEPEIYNDIKEKIEATEKERDKLIQNFINSIKPSLDATGIPYKIFHRLKSVRSIYDKMQKKKIPFEEVYDLFAIRIITESNTMEDEMRDCFSMLAAIYTLYKPNQERFRDWLSIPKANGYESLHTTVMYTDDVNKKAVWIEVQIRTTRMNEIAEKGYAAHWKYKSNTELSKESRIEEWLNKVRDILHSESENAMEILESVQTTLVNEEIYVFTPKGELKSLPVKSTVIDFAYSIHSAIGDKCISAKVNKKLVPIYHVLHNGDQVEIITSNKQTPKIDWLQHVVTAKAQQRIKNALNEEKKKIAEEGKEILARKLNNLDVNINQERVNKMVSYFNLKSAQELFINIASAKISMAGIKEFVEKERNNFFRRILRIRPKIQSQEDFKSQKESSILLFGDKLESFDYELSNCCNPIPGDSVFGFISNTEKGIKVHRTNCPNAENLHSKFAYRVIKARWTNNRAGQFLSGILISGFDAMGLVNNITSVISKELNVNIHSINFETSEGAFEGRIMLYVADRKHLDELIKKLKKLEGVKNIQRIT
ncbi:MAG: GTP pyrophosphokinase [Bacteroidetes bacterium ADurb.Bin408]|nr:MAG: GTP pyrophosphokinase [Bacteroidetes bacterium ADurb.Bin408]